MTLAITGKVWVFGNDLNTDAMYPAFAMKMDPPEAANMSSTKCGPAGPTRCRREISWWPARTSGWARRVRSPRCSPNSASPDWSPKSSIRCSSVTPSTPGCPRLTLPEATTIFSEGDTGTFDLSSGAWRNDTTGASGSVPRLPDLILDIISSGGVLPRLAAQGYLPAELGDLLRSSTVAIRGAGSGA